MATKIKIRKGDSVQVLTGKDAGKRGTVQRVLPTERRILVEKVNMIKRHTKPRPMRNPSRMGAPQVQPGGVIEKAAPIQISNVMVVCPTCRRPTRVGTVFRESKGRKTRVRVCRREDCRQEIDK